MWLNFLYVTCLGILNKYLNGHPIILTSAGLILEPIEFWALCSLKHLLRMPRHVTYKRFSHINGNHFFHGRVAVSFLNVKFGHMWLNSSQKNVKLIIYV